ncbi:MAG: hypothetical protein NDJ18_05755 [candidate division Zixibacteria bacterium]|nr:hypothetical protein [candidate division Zixibacteria bacterium]
MTKFATAVCLILLLSAAAIPAVASDANAFLNASAWQVDYEITFTAASQGSYQAMFGQYEYTTSLERVLNASTLLDLRSGGQSISMLRTAAAQDPSAMSVAEAQKFAMDMMAKIDVTANWMSMGPTIPEDATDQQARDAVISFQESQMGTARLNYTEVIKGDNLVSEMGTPFKSSVRTTYSGSGKVLPAGQISMEMDISTKKYLLMISTGFTDQSEGLVKVEEATHQESSDSPPVDSVKESTAKLDHIPQRIEIDEPTMTQGQAMLLEGTFDPALGKIVGEHKLRAHYEGLNGKTDGIVLVRITMTPRE